MQVTGGDLKFHHSLPRRNDIIMNQINNNSYQKQNSKEMWQQNGILED